MVPSPSAGTHEKKFSIEELPSITSSGLPPASTPQPLGFTPMRLPLTQAEDMLIPDKETSINPHSLSNLEWMVGKKVLRVFYSWSGSLEETH